MAMLDARLIEASQASVTWETTSSAPPVDLSDQVGL